MITLKRAYEPASRADGTRFLVERLWPRGISKAKLKVDAWVKEVGPSTKLRKWFGHDPAHWNEFRRRYSAELHEHRGELDRLRNLARKRRITLVYAARAETHNAAAVLRDILLGRR